MTPLRLLMPLILYCPNVFPSVTVDGSNLVPGMVLSFAKLQDLLVITGHIRVVQGCALLLHGHYPAGLAKDLQHRSTKEQSSHST